MYSIITLYYRFYYEQFTAHIILDPTIYHMTIEMKLPKANPFPADNKVLPMN